MITVEHTGPKYPFLEINVGEGFLAPRSVERSIRVMASQHKRKGRGVFKVTRENETYVLVERVA